MSDDFKLTDLLHSKHASEVANLNVLAKLLSRLNAEDPKMMGATLWVETNELQYMLALSKGAYVFLTARVDRSVVSFKHSDVWGYLITGFTSDPSPGFVVRMGDKMGVKPLTGCVYELLGLNIVNP